MSDLHTEFSEIVRLTKAYLQQMQEIGFTDLLLKTAFDSDSPPQRSSPTKKEIPQPPPSPEKDTIKMADKEQQVLNMSWEQRVKEAQKLYQRVYRSPVIDESDSLFTGTRPDSPQKDSPFTSLSCLKTAFQECTRCSLGETRTNFVFGVGNPEAGLVFCGEAPGEQEDLKGEPFVGRAGQLLDKILAAIDLTRDEIYILNVLKCRPPQNRDPLPEERESCRPILEAQLALIQPKIICALGRSAAQALLKVNTSLGKLRGTFHDFNGIPLMVTYHPAALLRNPHWKRPTWEDMQLLRDRYHELTK